MGEIRATRDTPHSRLQEAASCYPENWEQKGTTKWSRATPFGSTGLPPGTLAACPSQVRDSDTAFSVYLRPRAGGGRGLCHAGTDYQSLVRVGIPSPSPANSLAVTGAVIVAPNRSVQSAQSSFINVGPRTQKGKGFMGGASGRLGDKESKTSSVSPRCGRKRTLHRLAPWRHVQNSSLKLILP